MNLGSSKDSMFSSGKPKNLPWFFFPVLLGLAALIFLFKWFD